MMCNCAADPDVELFEIRLDENFPRWLKKDDYQTEQTSGITFLGKNGKNEKSFLLADDIGKIHRLVISSDTIFSITPIQFSNEAENFFKNYPKLDFEEIFYDHQSKEVYLSVEGNGEYFFDQTAIFKVIFRNDDVFGNEIINFEKILFEPQQIFTEYIGMNIGYEGFTADSKYFYLGLEGRASEEGFADSTFILIAEKNTKKIIKVISTKNLNIHTICGLYSDVDFSLWGIDRNNRKLFYILFDDDFSVMKNRTWQLSSVVPGYRNYNYTGSFEGITLVGSNVYIVDDPWYKYFKPSEDTLNIFDEKTVSNFDNFVPLIYKFNLNK